MEITITSPKVGIRSSLLSTYKTIKEQLNKIDHRLQQLTTSSKKFEKQFSKRAK